MTSKEDLKSLKDVFLTIKQEWLEDSNVKLTEWQKNVFESLEKDLKELEYQKRKNADLLETINCIRNHSVIKKTKGEVIVSFHNNDKDFEKVGWVFGIVK